jgi:undecaprenyl-diphosphatase
MKRWLTALFLVLVILGVTYALVARLNFHEVIPGEVYRSAQLSGSTLKRHVRENGIQTVINLRQADSNVKWYREEMEAVAELEVNHHSIGMFASSPRVDQVIELHDLIRGVERPLLVHCRAGIDRTGLASVLALLIGEQDSLDEIQKHVGWKFGALRDDNTGKVFLAEYRNWLSDTGKKHTADELDDWLRNDYLDPTGNIHFLVHPINGKNWYKPFGRYEEGEKFRLKRAESTELTLDGWAFDTRNKSLLAGLEVFIDGEPVTGVEYGIHSPWLIDDFGTDKYVYSGWETRHPMESLADGCHDLGFRFTRLDGSTWQSPPAGRICID